MSPFFLSLTEVHSDSVRHAHPLVRSHVFCKRGDLLDMQQSLERFFSTHCMCLEKNVLASCGAEFNPIAILGLFWHSNSCAHGWSSRNFTARQDDNADLQVLTLFVVAIHVACIRFDDDNLRPSSLAILIKWTNQRSRKRSTHLRFLKSQPPIAQSATNQSSICLASLVVRACPKNAA